MLLLLISLSVSVRRTSSDISYLLGCKFEGGNGPSSLLLSITIIEEYFAGLILCYFIPTTCFSFRLNGCSLCGLVGVSFVLSVPCML